MLNKKGGECGIPHGLVPPSTNRGAGPSVVRVGFYGIEHTTHDNRKAREEFVAGSRFPETIIYAGDWRRSKAWGVCTVPGAWCGIVEG